MPLARRVPKRGFFNGAFKKSYAVVNLTALEARFRGRFRGRRESPPREQGWSRARNSTASRSSATGELSKPLEVHATKFSDSAASQDRRRRGQDPRRPLSPACRLRSRPREIRPSGS